LEVKKLEIKHFKIAISIDETDLMDKIDEFIKDSIIIYIEEQEDVERK